MKLLLLSFLLAASLAAQCPSSNSNGPITGFGDVSVLNGPITYDATNPSGESFDRTILYVFYSTAKGLTDSTSSVAVDGSGHGWMNVSPGGFFQYACNLSVAKVRSGMVVYWPLTTISATFYINNSGGYSTGATSLNIQSSANTTNPYWPNLNGCTNCTGFSLPATIIVGGNTASQEVRTMSASTSASGTTATITIDALTHNQANGIRVDIPQTQFPAAENGAISFYRWCAANCGAGTYPGNPHKIIPAGVSSDATNNLLAVQLGPSLITASNMLWWNRQYSLSLTVPGATTSNTNTNYGFAAIANVSDLLDIPTAAAASSLALTATSTHWGCNVTDTGCSAFETATSARSLTAPSVPVFFLQGALDTGIANPTVACPLWPGPNRCDIVSGQGHGANCNNVTPTSGAGCVNEVIAHSMGLAGNGGNGTGSGTRH